MNLAVTYVYGHGVPLIFGFVSVLPVYLSLGLLMLRKRRLAIFFIHIAAILFILHALASSFGILQPVDISVQLSVFWAYPPGSIMVCGYIIGVTLLVLFHVAMIYGPSRNRLNRWWGDDMEKNK